MDYRGVVAYGPPSLDIYWKNRRVITSDEMFNSAVKGSSLTMTEYVIRVAAFLEESNCRLQSLTATTYSVNIIIFTDMLKTDIHRLLLKHGL